MLQLSCSRYANDTTFRAAEYDAYIFPWEGLNEGNPEQKHADIENITEKAMRWAIGSIVK
jgi:hypothetical protein